MRLAIAVIPFVLAAIAPAAGAQTTTRTVTSTADAGPGSLRDTIQSMTFDGTWQKIVFAVPPNSTIALASALPTLVGTQVEIDGSGAPGLVIDGGGQPMFAYNGQALTMRQLHVRGGRATGGGCVSVNTTLSASFFDMTFSNCITDGTAASGSAGGAIRAIGPARITRSVFTGNRATDGGIDSLSLGGGAVYISGASTLIEDSRFTDNHVVRTPNVNTACIDSNGGAVALGLVDQGSALVRRSRFERNDLRCASVDGAISGQAGALSAFGTGSNPAPALTIESSYFGGNRSGNGGAIFARAVRLQVENSSFYENDGGNGAGNLFLTSGFGASPPTPELTVRSSTFWKNATTSPTFGAHIHVNTNAGAILREVRNTVFAPPANGTACMPTSADLTTGDVVFTTTASCFYFVGGNSITSQFATDNTFGLQPPNPGLDFLPALVPAPTSVLVDNGTNTGCPQTDQWSLRRPFDGDGNGTTACDVGAIEYRPLPVFGNGFEN